MEKSSIKRRLSGLAMGAVAASMLVAPAAFALPGSTGDRMRYNEDKPVNCIENGWKYIPNASDPFAPAPHCFWGEPENAAELEPIASVKDSYPSKEAALAALEKVENTSPLDPNNYLAKDAFAYQKLSGKEPISPYSYEISRTTTDSSYTNGNGWATGTNGGRVGDSQWASNESIAIFVVDSKNPEQHYINVETEDNRVVANATNRRMMTGQIPLPKWAADQLPTSSGDKSIAIYDAGTGIWRSMFHVTPTEGKENTFGFASGGFIQAKPNFEGYGEDNYWMTLMSSGSSVGGITNELTQVGVEEVRAGKINHMVSMTWQDYAEMTASFPLKITDGRMNPEKYPYAPKVGQVGTLPADFDVDGYVNAINGGEFFKAYLTAMKEYGFIITDRNAVISGINFEHPLGYAKYAREGKNVYVEDPEISKALQGWSPYRLPYMSIQWIEPNYAGYPLNQSGGSVKESLPPDKIALPANTMVTSQVYTNVYEGERAYENVMWDHIATSGPLSQKAYTISELGAENTTTPQMKIIFTKAGSFANVFTAAQYAPEAGFIGEKTVEIIPDPQGATIATEEPMTWTVKTVPTDKPLSRTDYAVMNSGESLTISPLENDDTAKGQGSDGFNRLSLLNDAGEEVPSLKIGGTTFTAEGENVVVATEDNENGFVPVVRYRAYTEDGESSDGYISAKVLGDNVDSAVNPTPEPTEEPTPEPTDQPSENPTPEPTDQPSANPTPEPSEEPTEEPTPDPTSQPSEEPTPEPSEEPSEEPTPKPTPDPTEEPSDEPKDEEKPDEKPTDDPKDEDKPGITTGGDPSVDGASTIVVALAFASGAGAAFLRRRKSNK